MSVTPASLGFVPEWPAPASVRAFVSCRQGGFSSAPFDSNNLALHVGDQPARVADNRRQLCRSLGLPAEPAWLNQVHGTQLVEAAHWAQPPSADGVISHRAGQVCVVLTADCLPVLLCDDQGQQVAAVHGGWRGLVDGILAMAVRRFAASPVRLMAYLGPAISRVHYEVGPEVVRACAAAVTAPPHHYSQPSPRGEGRVMLDLYALARLQLQDLGVEAIYGGGHCTFAETQRFYSYRRDGRSGRMASLIWRQ